MCYIPKTNFVVLSRQFLLVIRQIHEIAESGLALLLYSISSRQCLDDNGGLFSTLKYSAFIGATRSENSQNICNGIPIRTVQEQYEAQWKVETDKL